MVGCGDEVILTSRNKIIILNKYSDIKVVHGSIDICLKDKEQVSNIKIAIFSD